MSRPTYTWQADDRAVRRATRDLFGLFLKRRGMRSSLGVAAGSLAIIAVLGWADGSFPVVTFGFAIGGFVLCAGGIWYSSRTIANALFGERITWTTTYRAHELVVETPEGTARFAYADLTDHAESGHLHGWALSRRRRLFLPSALVPPEAPAWIECGQGPADVP